MLVVMNVLVVLPLADSPTVDVCGIILLFVSLVAAKIGFNSVCDKIIWSWYGDIPSQWQKNWTSASI